MLFDARDRVGDDEVNYRCPSETVVFNSCESSKLRTHIHICELAIMTEGHGAHRNRSAEIHAHKTRYGAESPHLYCFDTFRKIYRS